MALAIKLGVSGWDAVKYVRNLIDDTTSPYIISDAGLRAYAEDVVEEFSRHIPMEALVGNVYASTSPITTVRGQQRYVCDAAHGFTLGQPILITDVLYRAGFGFSAASEVAYLALLPFSPINRFLTSPSILDSPTERVLRDEYLDELTKYGHGWAGIVRDPLTGLFAIDLYPVPATDGTPIFVRYAVAHTINQADANNWLIPTVPEIKKRDFAKLLYASVLEGEGLKLIQTKSAKAGLVQIQSDPRVLEMRIIRIREEVVASLGGYVGVGIAS